MKLWLGRILLTFAVFTLGYGLGKDVGLRQSIGGIAPVAVAGENKVLVYYLHTTIRCVTCNDIERQARNVVETGFAAAAAQGKVQWLEANFQQRDDLARRYEVASSTVVIVKIKDGQETAYNRLDQVWTLYEQPEQFASYVAAAIQTYKQELEL